MLMVRLSLAGLPCSWDRGSVSRWGEVPATPQVPAQFAAGAPQTARDGACGPRELCSAAF